MSKALEGWTAPERAGAGAGVTRGACTGVVALATASEAIGKPQTN